MDALASLKVASSEAVEACKREKREKHKAGLSAVRIWSLEKLESMVQPEELKVRSLQLIGSRRRKKAAILNVH